MKKHALLVQAHQDISYFIALAKREPNINIYVHIDKKSDYFLTIKGLGLPNLTLLEKRVAVYWGGYSQVEATLNLFKAACANTENYFFHLVSGEDILLQSFADIEEAWEKHNYNAMMTCTVAPQYAYRFIMDSPQADSDWQRKLSGKIMTKFQQAIAKIKTYDKPIYFGSQWFSITRDDWQQILPFINTYSDFFRHKLVPDEHFFQTILQEQTQINLSDDNKRFIIFDKNVNNGNSPIYLSLEQLQQAQHQKFWFARKVKLSVSMAWLAQDNKGIA